MTIIGKKLKMTQIFKDDTSIPVTVIKVVKKEDLDTLKEGDFVIATGITKGKGFHGVVKRYSFAGGPKTHGQKNRYRAPGSIGATAPQRVIPGRKMAGRMGGATKTIRNLKVVQVNAERQTMLLRGSVPGNANSRIKLRKVERIK